MSSSERACLPWLPLLPLVVLILLFPPIVAEEDLAVTPTHREACEGVRQRFHLVADRCLLFFSDGSPNGASNTGDRGLQRLACREASQIAAKAIVDLQRQGQSLEEACEVQPEGHSDGPEQLCLQIFLLLCEPKETLREFVLHGQASFLKSLFRPEHHRWTGLLHSGWPVFRLLALLEYEIRATSQVSLWQQLLSANDDAEQCNDEQEIFREVAVMYGGEGRTMKLLDALDFLERSMETDPLELTTTRRWLTLAYGRPNISSCLATVVIALIGVVDSLQCHWHRPISQLTRQWLDTIVDRAQFFAAEAFGHAAESMLMSRWPVWMLLARLKPPYPALPNYEEESFPGDGYKALVSWSSREAELGGGNWAKVFAENVFGDEPGFELQEDVECSDVFVFRSYLPSNFGGFLLFVDGERSPADSNYEDLLSHYPASITVGPMSPGGLSIHYPVPYAATSFASRLEALPRDLALPFASRPSRSSLDDAEHAEHEGSSEASVPHSLSFGQRRFAAYLAYRCWEHRERFYRVLDRTAREAGLEGVVSLSRCGNASLSHEQRRPKRYSQTYIDEAVSIFADFQFAMVLENRLSPRYVTEKIVNAFLAGAIPIYWGSPFVFRMFNPRAFIHVSSFANYEAAATYIVRVAQDPDLYKAFLAEPPLRNTLAANWPFSWHRDASAFHSHLLRQQQQQQQQPQQQQQQQRGRSTVHESSTGSNGSRAEDGAGYTRSLREELVEVVRRKHHSGLGGEIPAVERRPWDFGYIFRKAG